MLSRPIFDFQKDENVILIVLLYLSINDMNGEKGDHYSRSSPLNNHKYRQ